MNEEVRCVCVSLSICAWIKILLFRYLGECTRMRVQLFWQSHHILSLSLSLFFPFHISRKNKWICQTQKRLTALGYVKIKCSSSILCFWLKMRWILEDEQCEKKTSRNVRFWNGDAFGRSAETKISNVATKRQREKPPFTLLSPNSWWCYQPG